MDFTDSSKPVEIAYFDRGPVDAKELSVAGFWSTYWYRGRIYGTEIARGLDVLALTPSEYLSENEVAAALLANQGELFNPQQQFPVTWPAEPVVAGAYLDQLQRGEALPASLASAVNEALEQSVPLLQGGNTDAGLASRLTALAGELAGIQADEPLTMQRSNALGQTLEGIAARLR